MSGGLKVFAPVLVVGLLAACSTQPVSTSPRSDPAASAASTASTVSMTAPATTTSTIAPTTTLPPPALDGSRFGYAVSTSLLDDERYVEVLERDARVLVPENAMKWENIHPARGVYDFDDADRIVELAEANGQTVRGHPLIWHNQLPEWVEDGSWDRDSLIEVLRSHITRIVAHYADNYPGVVVQWDVVNEAFASDGERRESIWQEVIGDDYIELAFRFARAADPDASLFLNDYFDDAIVGGERTDRGASASRTSCDDVPKCAATSALAQQFVDDGVPLDGIGFQGHIFDLEATDYREFAAWTLPLGLQWALTEVDVALPSDESDDDASLVEQQADVYVEMVDACAQSVNCNTVVIWGVHDEQSWIPRASEGALGRALLYDAQFEPKPATARVIAAAARLAGEQ